ncbi:unnamed protein product, partial [Brassica oleracea var. botrytis]
ITVATSVDSLLEKLKHRQFPPPTRASPPSSSFVSVSSPFTLFMFALNALQGVESSLISIHKLSYVLCSEPADRTTHQSLSLWHRLSSTDALGQIL